VEKSGKRGVSPLLGMSGNSGISGQKETKVITVGDIRTDLDIIGTAWTIQAIALKWDILDVAVFTAKSDLMGWITAEYDIRRDNIQKVENFTDAEESTQDYCSRAFGM